MHKKIWVIPAIIAGGLLAAAPPFEGLERQAMIYLGIFTVFLTLLISAAVPDWAAGLTAASLLVLFKIGSIEHVFAPFGQSTIWLIIAIFMLAAAIENSGLITRLALKILFVFPPTYQGQIMALMGVGVVLGPLIPSANAKVNLLIPVATALTKQIGFAERSRAALGLFSATYLPAYIGANAFLSGGVNVAVIRGFLTDELRAQLTWTGWLSATCVWLLAILIGTYIYCMTYCKPKESVDLPPDFIAERLAALGPISRQERITAIVVICMLAASVTQGIHGVGTETIALLSALFLAACRILTTEDLMKRIPWTLIIFIGCLLSVAGYMGTLGVSLWLSGILKIPLAPLVNSVWIFVPALCVITYLLRFVLISQIACLTVLYAIFAPLLASAGISLFVLVFVEYMSGNVWNTRYQNPFPLATIGIAGGKYVTFEDFRKTSWAYMLMSLVGMIASIPVWMFFGLC